MAGSRADSSLKVVVIGSGFAGLSAAAGFSKLFDSVVRSLQTRGHTLTLFAARTRCCKSRRKPGHTITQVQYTQVLLDKDDFTHSLSAEADSDPLIWRQQYEVTSHFLHSHAIPALPEHLVADTHIVYVQAHSLKSALRKDSVSTSYSSLPRPH